MAKPQTDRTPQRVRFSITVTERADEWSPHNPALLMPTQSAGDTPGPDLARPVRSEAL